MMPLSPALITRRFCHAPLRHAVTTAPHEVAAVDAAATRLCYSRLPRRFCRYATLMITCRHAMPPLFTTPLRALHAGAVAC